MRIIAIVAICVTAAIVAVGDFRHGNDGVVQKALSLRRLQLGPSAQRDCPPIRGEPNLGCLDESESDSTSSDDGGPELVGSNPNSSGTPQQGDDGCTWSWGTPCSQGPALVGVNPDDARAPSLLRLKVNRELFKLRRKKKKLELFTKNRGYSFEYFLEEYRIQRRGLRGSQRSLEDADTNFQDITYTRVRVSDVGVTRPAGHESASNLINRIQEILQRARGDPSKLGHYRLVYSRRFGLPRFCYIEYGGYVTKIAARRLRFTDGAASPSH